MIRTITKNAVILTIFAVICTGIVAVVNDLTKPVIKIAEQNTFTRTIKALITPGSYNNDLFATCFTVSDQSLLGTDKPQKVFIAKKDKTPTAVILEATTQQGYSGEIKIIIAIKTDGTIAGVRVTKHSETPGLGDKIQTNKSNWIEGFNDQKYKASDDKHWDVKKYGGDFDAFTGATITPRAVVKAVKKASIYFNTNKDFLLKHKADCSNIPKAKSGVKK